MRIVRVVGAAILAEGRVLVARRSAKADDAGRWEFPGGKVEPGESDREALVREIAEELGAEIEVGGEVATTCVPRGERTIRLTVYKARLVHGTPERREHAELRWVAPDELVDLDLAEADVPAACVLAGQPASD